MLLLLVVSLEVKIMGKSNNATLRQDLLLSVNL